VFPLLSRKGREALRCDVYDLIAARQPERGVSARDRAELHSGKVDQIIIIPPLATAVVKSFLPDQQPFAVFGPVKRVAASTSDPSGEKAPNQANVASAEAALPKRQLSAAGRKAIADAAKRRWALIKAGKAASPFAAKGAKKKAGK
jgi:hypothetical protein